MSLSALALALRDVSAALGPDLDDDAQKALERAMGMANDLASAAREPTYEIITSTPVWDPYVSHTISGRDGKNIALDTAKKFSRAADGDTGTCTCEVREIVTTATTLARFQGGTKRTEP